LAEGKNTLATSSRITVEEIARRLSVGRLTVYAMLEGKIIPAIRLRRRWIISRFAFEEWLRTCGTGRAVDSAGDTEVRVV
jgi:excisionase family DNA binding protein